VTTEELRTIALDLEKRLLESGDPLSGDDWGLMQVVRGYLRITGDDCDIIALMCEETRLLREEVVRLKAELARCERAYHEAADPDGYHALAAMMLTQPPLGDAAERVLREYREQEGV
jgi:hypothetical protein